MRNTRASGAVVIPVVALMGEVMVMVMELVECEGKHPNIDDIFRFVGNAAIPHWVVF